MAEDFFPLYKAYGEAYNALSKIVSTSVSRAANTLLIYGVRGYLAGEPKAKEAYEKIKKKLIEESKNPERQKWIITFAMRNLPWLISKWTVDPELLANVRIMNTITSVIHGEGIKKRKRITKKKT